MSGNGRRPHVLVLNQYYWPGVEATAHLLTELCEHLAQEYRVTVVTGALFGVDAAPGRSVRNGVEIVRVRSTAYDRSQLPLRALNYVTYLAGSLWTALRIQKPDVVLCMTDPPMIGDLGVAVARRANAPLLVVSQDVFPEIAVELRRLENPALVGLLRGLVEFYLRRASRVVAIGDTMAERLVAKGVRADRVAVIPNWVDATHISPRPRDNEWARRHGVADKFVVMHSGNVGHAQNLDLLIRAATFLRDLEDLEVLVIGGGARHGELVALAERLDADNVRFLKYQDRANLSESLGSADMHYVGLAPRLSGFVVPSRLYGILAAGRPVIAAADSDSETAEVVRSVGCGVAIRPDRPDELAAVIRRAHAGELDLAAMGAAGREYVEREADRPIALARYSNLVGEVAGVRDRR